MSVDFLSKNFPPFQVHHAKKPPRFYPDGFQRNVIDFYFIFSDCRLRKALYLQFSYFIWPLRGYRRQKCKGADDREEVDGFVMKERVQNFAAQMVDADDKHKVHDEIERRIRTKEHQDAVIQHQTELMRIAVYISAFLQHGAVAEPERLCGIED